MALAVLELNKLFKSTGVIDFTELLLSAQAALGEVTEPSDLALALDYRINHLLVDEFQDTSISQFRLFELLLAGWSSEEGNTFFAVGDPMQSIYRFRDAEVSLFVRAWESGIADVARKAKEEKTKVKLTFTKTDLGHEIELIEAA